jgi:heme/copper-type cytochrome/quinol oxidase subunit 2
MIQYAGMEEPAKKIRNPYTYMHEYLPESWQFGFLRPATDIMEGIIDLHHDIMFFLIVISLFVS